MLHRIRTWVTAERILLRIRGPEDVQAQEMDDGDDDDLPQWHIGVVIDQVARLQ